MNNIKLNGIYNSLNQVKIKKFFHFYFLRIFKNKLFKIKSMLLFFFFNVVALLFKNLKLYAGWYIVHNDF